MNQATLSPVQCVIQYYIQSYHSVIGEHRDHSLALSLGSVFGYGQTRPAGGRSSARIVMGRASDTAPVLSAVENADTFVAILDGCTAFGRWNDNDLVVRGGPTHVLLTRGP